MEAGFRDQSAVDMEGACRWWYSSRTSEYGCGRENGNGAGKSGARVWIATSPSTLNWQGFERCRATSHMIFQQSSPVEQATSAREQGATASSNGASLLVCTFLLYLIAGEYDQGILKIAVSTQIGKILAAASTARAFLRREFVDHPGTTATPKNFHRQSDHKISSIGTPSPAVKNTVATIRKSWIAACP
jgi:hypothetical protein